MEPKTETQRVTVEDARKTGLERINRLLNFVAPVFAPEKLAAAGWDAAKEKWEKSKTKEQLDAFIEKAGKASRRLGRRWEELNDRVDARTDEIAKRAVLLGLKPVVGAESGIKWFASDVPMAIREFVDSRREAKQEKLRAKLRKIEVAREQGAENRRKDRERGKKMVSVRKLAESLQTKG